MEWCPYVVDNQHGTRLHCQRDAGHSGPHTTPRVYWQNPQWLKPASDPAPIEAGTIEVGRNEKFEVVINLDHDRNDIGHIVFSPRQARHLANSLMKHATEALLEWREAQRKERP